MFFSPHQQKQPPGSYQVTVIISFQVLSDLFRGEQGPPFGESKGHLEEAGQCLQATKMK